MKRIKNSVKALIISVCVLVVAVATVLTVVLVTRKKDDGTGGNNGPKYTLTAAQLDLVNAINAKNLAEFNEKKKTFTVGEGPLFVDEYGVAVDANKITYVYDDYFTAEVDGTEEVFIFNPADETKTIRLSKYLKDNEVIKSNYSNLNFYDIENSCFVITYHYIENEIDNAVCIAVNVDFNSPFDGNNFVLIYEKTLTFVDGVYFIDGNTMAYYEVSIHGEYILEYTRYEKLSIEYTTIKVFKTNNVTSKNNILFETSETRTDDVVDTSFNDNAYYVMTNSSIKIYNYALNQVYTYVTQQGTEYSLELVDAGVVVAEGLSNIKFYSIETNSVYSLSDNSQLKFSKATGVDDTYFSVYMTGNESKMYYYDNKGELVIDYNSKNSDDEIYYSNGRKIVTKYQIISTYLSGEVFVDYNFESESSNFVTKDIINSYLPVNSSTTSFIDINKNQLLDNKDFEKTTRLNEDYYIASDLGVYYLLNLLDNTKSIINLNEEFFDKIGAIKINNDNYFLVSNNSKYNLINSQGVALVAKDLSNHDVTLDEIDSYSIGNIANRREITFISGTSIVKLYAKSNYSVSSNGQSSGGVTYATSSSNTQTAEPYGAVDGTKETKVGHVNGKWNDAGTEVTFTTDKGYYFNDTEFSFVAKGRTTKDPYVNGIVDWEHYDVTAGKFDNNNLSYSLTQFNDHMTFKISGMYSTGTFEGWSGPVGAGYFGSFSIDTSLFYMDVIINSVASGTDYNNLDNTDSTKPSLTNYKSQRYTYTTDSDNDRSLPDVGTPTIVGGKYKGLRTLSDQYAVSSCRNSSVRSEAEKFKNDYILTYKFKTRYSLVVFSPITYTIKVEYGVKPGTSTKLSDTESVDGLKKTYSASYTKTYGDETGSTYRFVLGSNPESWLYRFEGWHLTDSRKANDAGKTYKSYSEYATDSLHSLCITDGATCKFTAQWSNKTIYVNFKYTFPGYDGALTNATGGKLSLADLRVTVDNAAKDYGLKINNSKDGNLTPQSGSSLTTSYCYFYLKDETKKISALTSSSMIETEDGKTAYNARLTARTINSTYVLNNCNSWLVQVNKDSYGDTNDAATFKTISSANSSDTIKELIKSRENITAAGNIHDSYTITIIATYSIRKYEIYLQESTGYYSGENTSKGGKIIDGSIIKGDNDGLVSDTNGKQLTTLDITNSAATYQFVAKDGEKNGNIVNTDVTFEKNYNFLGSVHIRIEATKLNSNQERAYLLQEVKLTHIGAYTTEAQTNAFDNEITLTRTSTKWEISSKYTGTGDSFALLGGKYCHGFNKVSGTADRYYNSIEIKEGNDYYIYIIVHNLGVTLDASQNYDDDGTRGFTVEATAKSNQQPKDSITVNGSGENPGSGQVTSYAVMNVTAANKVWINNQEVAVSDLNPDYNTIIYGNNYAFIGLEERNTVKGAVTNYHVNSYNSKIIYPNYGNTNVIVVRPNQSYYYNSQFASTLAGSSGTGSGTSRKELYYSLQSYLSQIVIDGVTYHLKLDRTISEDSGGYKYSNYQLYASETGDYVNNSALVATHLGGGEQIYSFSTFKFATNVSDDRVYTSGGSTNAKRSAFKIINGFKIPSDSSHNNREFEIYLAICEETLEVLYFVFSDNVYNEASTTSNKWYTSSIQFTFTDFENKLQVNVPPYATEDAALGYGADEFIVNKNEPTGYDQTTVVYEYMYATAGTYYDAGLGLGTNSVSANSAIRKYNSTGLRVLGDNSDTPQQHSYLTYFGQTNAYLDESRTFKYNPNETVVFLFHPKDGYLINCISVKINGTELYKIELSKSGPMSMKYDYGNGIVANNHLFEYSSKYLTADTFSSAADFKAGIYVTNSITDVSWITSTTANLNSVYLMVSGISDNVTIDVQTTSYLEFDFVDYAAAETAANSFSGLITQKEGFRGDDVVAANRIDILNKLQIMYKNDSGDWTRVVDPASPDDDPNNDDDPKFIKHQLAGAYSVYRVIFFGNVNIFKDGVKFYLSGPEYSSYMNNLATYCSTGNTYEQINGYILDNNADVTGRTATGATFYNGGSQYIFGNTDPTKNKKQITSQSDVLTYLYINDLRKLFSDISPNDNRTNNIYNKTLKREFSNKFYLKFDVHNNFVDYNIGSYLYNNQLKTDYDKIKEEGGITGGVNVEPLNISLTPNTLQITTINDYIKFIESGGETIGAYQLDFVSPGSVLKQYSWFNDVMLSNIREQKTIMDTDLNLVKHYLKPSDNAAFNDSSYYNNYDNGSGNLQYWQDYQSLESMALNTSQKKKLYGYGVEYEYINIPGYNLQYIEISTVDYGNIYINVESIYSKRKNNPTEPYIVYLNPTHDDENLEDFFIAISVEIINVTTDGEDKGKSGYKIRLYESNIYGQNHTREHNYGDTSFGRNSIEIISNNIGINFYLNAYDYTIKYNANKNNAGSKVSSTNDSVQIIEGESVLEGKDADNIGEIEQQIFYDTLTTLNYQLYMPGYTFIGWGSQNYYDLLTTSDKNRYDSTTNTWNSSALWANPCEQFTYNSTKATPWLSLVVQDAPYDFYVKNNYLNGYFITDTGISGALLDKLENNAYRANYVDSQENYNFWYAYASMFTQKFVQNESNKTITLYAIWKTNVYSLMFDTNDSNIYGLTSTPEQENDETYNNDLSTLKNGSTTAKLNIISSNFATSADIPTLNDYKNKYLYMTDLYNDIFTSDGRGYNVSQNDTVSVATPDKTTFYCYVAFDSDNWFITTENSSVADSYYAYYDPSADVGLNGQFVFGSASGNLLNLVIDRYGYSWLGWFTKKLDNAKSPSSSEISTLKNQAVFTSNYLNGGGAQTGTLPVLNYSQFVDFDDRCDFDIKNIEEPAPEEPAPASEPEATEETKVNGARFVYTGEHRIYDDPTLYLNYVNLKTRDGKNNDITAYISFYAYLQDSTYTTKITLDTINDKTRETTFAYTTDQLNNKNKTLYRATKEYGKDATIYRTIEAYFDTSVSYDCYKIINNPEVNDAQAGTSHNHWYSVELVRKYSQVMEVKTEGEGENEEKIISLKRSECNFRYVKFYANWEVNKYTIVLDKQDNSSSTTLNREDSSTSANGINLPSGQGAQYFDDEEFAIFLNNHNPTRIGYDFLGWSFYYYDINEDILEKEDDGSYEYKLNQYYKKENIINRPSVYEMSKKTNIESTLYLNQTLLDRYIDYIYKSGGGAAVTSEPVAVAEGEGGAETPPLTQEEKEKQELAAAGLSKINIIPLYTRNDAINKYVASVSPTTEKRDYKFTKTYNSVSKSDASGYTEDLYQEQYGDSEHTASNVFSGNKQFTIYLFAIWRAQEFVINTSLNVENQQLENLYDEDSRFALAFYNAVTGTGDTGATEPGATPAAEEETPAEGEGADDPYANYRQFLGINSNNYKLIYEEQTESIVLDKTYPDGKLKDEDSPTHTITDNMYTKVQFTDIVATVYFTVKFDQSLLDAYFEIPDKNDNKPIKYYLKDLFAVSAGYYFLGWVTKVDGDKDSLSSGKYIVRNTLMTLFSNLDNYTDNVVLRPVGEETEEQAAERVAGMIDSYYSRYVFGNNARTNEDFLENHYADTIFDLDYYSNNLYVTNYKHHFAEGEKYLEKGTSATGVANYKKLSEVDGAGESTSFGYVKIAANDVNPTETICYITIDDLVASTDTIGITNVENKLHFRYNGWKYYVYYYIKKDENSQIEVLNNDYKNLYYIDKGVKYIVRFDSDGYAYAITQDYSNYNKRLVFDHTGKYAEKYPDEVKPVELYLAVYREGHRKIQVKVDPTTNINTFVDFTPEGAPQLVEYTSNNEYLIDGLVSEDGKNKADDVKLTFVPCQTRQFTVYAHWQNKDDFVINVINGSNLLPKEVPEEGEEGEETEGEEGEEPPAEEETEEENELGYETSPTHNPGLAGYYELIAKSEHSTVNLANGYKQTFKNSTGVTTTEDQLDEKITHNYNYYDSLQLNILPYYNGRYLSSMKFTYYGVEENPAISGDIITNTFRNMRYTLEFKFTWNDEKRIIQIETISYRKDSQTAGHGSSTAAFHSLVLYKDYDEDDIKTKYYHVKDVGNLSEDGLQFTTFDSLGLLNENNFREISADGSEITEAEKYYMMRIFEYFEYDKDAGYVSACRDLSYILEDKTAPANEDYYIIEDINRVALNFPNIKTSIDIECQFSVQTFNVDFYNILDEEGNTITVQAGKSNVYDTNYETEEEFKEAYKDNDNFKSSEKYSSPNLPTIPKDCSNIDELGSVSGYNVPYGFFIYGVYFKSAFSPHRPIDTDGKTNDLPNNIEFLEKERYGFNYIYLDGNYNIGSTSRIFKFTPADEYDTDKHKYQCSPVLGSTSSFNEANGIRLDGLSFYMFGGWFEYHQNEETGRIELVLYNEMSEATYINRKITLYGYYYAVNTPTSITYYTWKEETQKYEPYTANKDQYALNANIEGKPFKKESDLLVKVEGQPSYTDSEKNAKIFTYQKYGVDSTQFGLDNYNEGDFRQGDSTDEGMIRKFLTTYWYYEDSYIVLKDSSNRYVKYDEDLNRFTLNGTAVDIKTTDMVNFFTGSGKTLYTEKKYSEKILQHKDDMGNYEVLSSAISGASLYYKYDNTYYKFTKEPDSSAYRYSTMVGGTKYYFLKKNSVSGGSSVNIYREGATHGSNAASSLVIIYDYFVIYDNKYYKILYGSNPIDNAETNLVNIPLGDENNTIAKCYFDYNTKRLYDIETKKEVRFLYDIYTAVNDNYSVSAQYSTPKWAIAGIKVKSLPSPNMTYWYNDEKYGLVGYIKLTDQIFEGMKKADSVFGDGEGEGGSGDEESETPEPTASLNELFGNLSGGTLYGEGTEPETGEEGTEGDGEGEEPDPEDDGIDENIKNGILYKAFMSNIEIMYKDIWNEYLDDGTTENPNYDPKFKRDLKNALGNYIGAYTKEQMLESFLIADEFHMNADNNAIEYITVNIPIKYSGEIQTKDPEVKLQVDISIIIKYKFDIISTNTLVEENIYAIPIYSPYLMSFDTNEPCINTAGSTIDIDVDAMDLWHFELTSKNTHVYNEENGDLLKLVILNEEEMIYLKKNMTNDIPTMLTVMFNNYQKHINGTLEEGKMWINPKLASAGGRVFVEEFSVVTNPDNTQYKDWYLKANVSSFASGRYYAIAYYEKSVNTDIVGTNFENYVVRVSDNIIRFDYYGSVDGYNLVTIDDITIPE